MRRDPLGEALREAAIPVPADAEQRGLEVVAAAYAQRQPRRQATPLPRLALAFAVATLLAALLLSPAGAAVRDWVDEAITTSAPRPQPELAEIPGGGRLLVQSMVGPWVVQPDGSRRLLGDYEEATWSPRGLFVAVARGRTLSAIEPDGTPRWSITAPRRVSDPRWAPSGERIAYRSGTRLQVVAGDGTEERELAAATAPVAPAWSPIGPFQIAYVTLEETLRIADSESAAILTSAPALPGITRLEWGGGASSLLESSPRSIRLRTVQSLKLAGRPRLGAPHRLPLPPGTTVVDAALAPKAPIVAAVLTRWREHGTRSFVLLFRPGADRPQSLLNVPGSLGEIAWSPNGRRLLVAWPGANQWVFLPLGRGQGRAVANISTAFSPDGRAASFPRLEGWCCRR